MKKTLLAIILLVCISSSAAFASEGKVSIDIVNFDYHSLSNNKIVGSFEIKNTTNNYANELFYTLSLVPEKFINENSRVYASAVALSESEPVKFSLASGEQKYIAFEYEVPSTLYKEDCMLILRFMTRTSTFSKESGIGIFNLGESENFLIPSDYKEAHYWDIDNFNNPLSGPYFNIGEEINGYIDLKSTFKNTIEVVPEYIVYSRGKSYENSPFMVVNGEKINFKAKEEKTIQLNFPKIDVPESYLVKVTLKDKNGLPVSHEYMFRYVINGVNAKILNVTTEYIKDTNSLSLNVSYSGPADGQTVSNTIMEVTAFDSKMQNRLLDVSEKIELTPSTFNFNKTFKLNGTAENVVLYIAIKYNDEILDTRKLDIETKAMSEKTENNMFFDIENKTCYDDVRMLNSFGIISGYPDGSFKPNNNITRAEFTSIALKIAGIDADKINEDKNAFSDVLDNHWAKKTINIAYDNGIISGYGEGLFKPDNNVTYSEALTILINVIGYKEFAQEKPLQWPDNYILASSLLKLMSNVDEVSYTDYATRGNVAIITLNAYLQKRV